MPTSVALSSHFEEFVRRQVETGRYNNVSEVVRAGLRMLEDAEAEQAAKQQALREAIAVGMASGPGIPADEVFARLETKYLAMADKTK
ncbi:type II toxin-antitoxin system ParD family antitoxin [Desulfuromonas thiophila]|uniref:Antitoxin ParD1/3/4 n=1 Tax=Desulfuromonas thiophila TaxID=57664 RepID=A0A1G7DD21_9BACT|nr:type II toxin-antitoxin system ParD family antitoxin [Desulfuromonas thiophila]SDE49528.1 antitoxin ParD1/3/4 [Desulfuromonas thiophila]